MSEKAEKRKRKEQRNRCLFVICEWLNNEPPKYRIFAHYKWLKNKPSTNIAHY